MPIAFSGDGVRRRSPDLARTPERSLSTAMLEAKAFTHESEGCFSFRVREAVQELLSPSDLSIERTSGKDREINHATT